MVTQRIQAREVGHRFQAKGLYPKSRGTFIRRRADVVELEREATGGTWGLLPWFAKTPEIEFDTVNARAEPVATAASYKAPWARGQRCIVPMVPSLSQTPRQQAHPLEVQPG